MHNNIMAVGSRDRLPMLAIGRYPQWRSRFLRYIDTRPNGEALRKCILNGPYKPTTVLVQVVEANDDSLAIPEHTTPKWSMFVMIVKQQHKLDKVSYQKLFNIMKQYQNKVNELRTKRLARNANPLALVSTVQANQDPYYQTSRSDKSHAPSSKPLIPTRSHITTSHKGKEIAKLITPPYETTSEKDSDLEQAQRDKDMQKNLALIVKYFKKIYKPTNNNLRTSSNSRNKNVDTTLWENVGSPVVQQSWIQCFNYKEFGHFAKEYRKPKRVKDSAYHKEKMLMCKQAEQGELEAHYSYMAKIQEVPTADSGTDFEPVEQVQNEVGYNVFANDLQHSEQSESNEQNDVESDDENVALSNLISNLKLDVDENKKIQKQLKKANTTLAQELKECKTILAETNQFRAPTAQDMEILIQTCLMPLATKTQNDSFRFVHELKQEMHADLKYVESLKKEIDELESDKAEFLNMYDVILQEYMSKDVMCSYLMSLSDLYALDELQCLYLHKLKECDCLAQKLSNQTESVSKEVHSELLKRFAKVEKHSISLEITLQKRKEQKLTEKGKGKYVDTKFDKPSVVRQPNAQRIPKPSALAALKVGNLLVQPRTRNRMKEAKIRVKICRGEELTYERKTKSQGNLRLLPKMTLCRGNIGTFRLGHRMLNDVNARTKKPNVVPISTRKPKSYVNKSVATSHKKKIVQLILFVVDSGCTKHITGNLKLLCNFIEKFLGTVRFGNDQFAPILGYGDLVQGNFTINRVYYVEGLNHNLFSVGQFCDADLEVAFRKSTCFVRDLQGNDLLTDAHVPSQQELDLLFGPLYDEFFNAGSNPQDKQPKTNIQSTSAPSTPTYVHAEEHNDNQAEEEDERSPARTSSWKSIKASAKKTTSCNRSCNVYVRTHHGRENDILNGPLKEEVYVAQPDGFVDPDHPKKVYRLRKALYGLKQAPRVWFDELSKFLTSKGFTKGDKLVSWKSKKQNCTAMSLAEAEYVALSARYAQVMWMRTQLQDYGFNYIKIPLYFDSQRIGMRCLTPAELEVLEKEFA
nr:integrase, catalytic region, zinc finger, CCHC-type, peptidase aspartic, catalytic [Tanacetum cinerariifolium]